MHLRSYYLRFKCYLTVGHIAVHHMLFLYSVAFTNRFFFKRPIFIKMVLQLIYKLQVNLLSLQLLNFSSYRLCRKKKEICSVSKQASEAIQEGFLCVRLQRLHPAVTRTEKLMALLLQDYNHASNKSA